MLPFVRVRRPGQHIQTALVVGDQAGEKVSIQTVQVLSCVADRESGMQIKQKAVVAQRPAKIEKDDFSVGNSADLGSEIDRDGAGADSAFGTHYRDQLSHTPGSFGRIFKA